MVTPGQLRVNLPAPTGSGKAPGLPAPPGHTRPLPGSNRPEGHTRPKTQRGRFRHGKAQPRPHRGAWSPAGAGKGPAPRVRAQPAIARSTSGVGMAAAAAAGSGTPREEEAPGGEAAATQAQAPTTAPGARLSRLPLSRVKALVKADPDVTLAGQEAIFILARAAVRRESKGAGVGGRGSGGVARAWPGGPRCADLTCQVAWEGCCRALRVCRPLVF